MQLAGNFVGVNWCPLSPPTCTHPTPLLHSNLVTPHPFSSSPRYIRDLEVDYLPLLENSCDPGHVHFTHGALVALPCLLLPPFQRPGHLLPFNLSLLALNCNLWRCSPALVRLDIACLPATTLFIAKPSFCGLITM